VLNDDRIDLFPFGTVIIETEENLHFAEVLIRCA